MSKIGSEVIQMAEDNNGKTPEEIALEASVKTINGVKKMAKASASKRTKAVSDAKNAKGTPKSDFEAFKQYVERTGSFVASTDPITGQKRVYLKIEAWQYLARMKDLIPTCESTVSIHSDYDYTVSTTCELRNENGRLVSSANMIASQSEPFLRDKPKYAVWGMSQTRAISRAVKNIYGYIVKGAGFEPTPALEVDPSLDSSAAEA